MRDSEILTTVLGDESVLVEILTRYRDKVRISGKMHRGQVRATIDFTPEILAEVFANERMDSSKQEG